MVFIPKYFGIWWRVDLHTLPFIFITLTPITWEIGCRKKKSREIEISQIREISSKNKYCETFGNNLCQIEKYLIINRISVARGLWIFPQVSFCQSCRNANLKNAANWLSINITADIRLPTTLLSTLRINHMVYFTVLPVNWGFIR